MLFYLFDMWANEYTALNVFRYLTFRGIVGALTALLLSLVVGPLLIRRLISRNIGQTVREDGPSSHLKKNGTPTMGGVLILFSVTLSTLLWADLSNRFVWVVLLTCLAFGFVGGVDDYMKQVKKRGISVRLKFLMQSFFGLLAASFLYYSANSAVETTLIVPFFKDVGFPLGLGYLALAYLMIVGSSNAVNLTDGLDGLAILPVVLIAGALGIFGYATGHSVFSVYLGIPYIPTIGETLVFCSALVGAGLGFLWFNTYPAQMFMGDIGALSIGAALGVLAVVVRQEIVFLVMGGVFVAETASVIVQVGWYKWRGNRVLKMAPLHHHFEQKGWPEPRIVVRFWIITLVLVLISLSTLKVR